MNENTFASWEQKIAAINRQFTYPPTPDIASRVGERLHRPTPSKLPRLALQAALVLLVLLAGLLAVPRVRAAVLEFLQIGAIRILPSSTAIPSIPPTATPSRVTVEPQTALATAPATRPVRPEDLLAISEIAGETTLEQGFTTSGFPALLPTYPPDLGLPDYVYLQTIERSLLVLVWMDPVQPEQVELSLHIFATGAWFGTKFSPRVVQETRLNGEPAIWAEGPYPLQLTNGEVAIQRMIAGHVLIWEQDNLTYRLETDLPLPEALEIAASLAPFACSPTP